MSEVEFLGIVDSQIVGNLKKKLIDLKGSNLDKNFKTNYKKKAKPLIEFIYREILSFSEELRADKSFFYAQLVEILIERGGNYFSHDNLQILKHQREANQFCFASFKGN